MEYKPDHDWGTDTPHFLYFKALQNLF